MEVFPFALLLLLTTSAVSAQKSQENTCGGSAGWSYSSSSGSSSSSASSSSGFASSSSSSSSFSISSICIQSKIPEDCIRANEFCQWCAQEDFSGQRCNTKSLLQDQKCSDIQTVESSTSLDIANEANRFNHQTASARIRVGGAVNIPFRIKEPEIYPVDLYYLMDVSYSMKADLESVKTLGKDIINTLQELTMGDEGSVQLGFGKFVDKVQSPMTQMTKYKLTHPYAGADPPFLFQSVVSLTPKAEEFESSLSNQTVSGNLDPPEGALEAMLQVVKCGNVIGWRGNALRLLMVATESAYHYGGDGSANLAGITETNDGECHTSKDGKYQGAETRDYPTVNQVVRAFEEESITPIFAIAGRSYSDMYEYVSENVFRGSTYGVLADDSKNIVDLVREAYTKITGRQEIVTINPDENVLCPGYMAALPGGIIQNIHTKNVINGLASGSKVYYNMSLSASRDACFGESLCNVGNVVAKTRLYDDKLTVSTSVVSAFGCSANVAVNSPVCGGKGNFSCGICICNPDWTGPSCDISTHSLGCRKTGALVDCSGKGECINGHCQCDPGYRHNKARIYGTFCECDDCIKTYGLNCSGHGIPVKGGPNDCSCQCECEPGWGYDDCSCSTSQETCISPDGLTCSNNGICDCGTCICKEASGFGGPTCSDCTTNCPSCQVFQDCIQCWMHNTGPYNKTCEQNCPGYNENITPETTNSMTADNTETGNGAVLCAAIDSTDNCKFYYSYQVLPSGNVFRAEREKRCRPSYSLLIILWCILLFLLIALILLCCWRCCVYVIDREEERNYNIANVPGLIPLLPAMGPSNVVEFIKAKYLVRRSARVAVIPVRRSFFKGGTNVMWRTYQGSSMDNELEVLGVGEEGTIMRKKQQAAKIEHLVVHGKNGDATIEIEALETRGVGDGEGMMVAGSGEAAGDLRGGRGGGVIGKQNEMNGQHQQNAAAIRYETVNEKAPLMKNYSWVDGEVIFKEDEEFGNIEIQLLDDLAEKQTSFWVELYGQEKGVALGLKRTKVIIIEDEEAGIIGFPKPTFVFKENDGFAIVPIHRTVGMDGKVSVAWSTRDITALSGKHYMGGRGVVEFNDAEVTQHLKIELIPDILYDETEKSFSIILEDPKGGASLDLSNCMVTTLCDEECALVQFPKDAYPFMENCGIAEVTVIRTHSTKGISSVRWYTEDDTAIAGKDYTASEGVITFSNVETEAHIRVSIIDNDVYDESGRAFRIILSDPSEGTKLANNIANISIIEDDEPGLFEFTKTNLVMRSKAQLGRLSVIRSLGTDGHIRVPWVIRQLGDNKISSDLLAMNGVLEFRNGEINKYLELNLSNIGASELMTFAVVLQHPTGGGKLGAKNEATVTVFAEEDFGTVSFAQTRFDVTASTGVATLLVSRKGDVSSAAFVMCETSDQSAISGKHYRGGTISVVFDAGETVKEVGIPVYNDPNYKGQLIFEVSLRSTPGGPKTDNPSEAVVAITCVAMAPVVPVGLALSGPCTVEFVKAKYLFRRSAKHASIPVHRTSSDGSCLIEWRATGPSVVNGRNASLSSSGSSSSKEENEDKDWGSGVIRFEDGQDSYLLELSLETRNISQSQISVTVELVNAVWGDSRDEELRLGLKKCELVILNDIDAGTLGFSKATFSFNENQNIIKIPVHRLGGMDGDVSTRWRSVEGTAREGCHYEGGEGIITFAQNQVSQNIQIHLRQGESFLDQDDEEDKKFTIELDQFKGGAKCGLRKTTIFIVGDGERSVVQFSKDSYPIIGNATSVKLAVLRTGSFQKRVAVLWRTQDGSARAGVDYRACQNLLLLEAGDTKSFIEVPLSGNATEPKEFTVQLETAQDQIQFISSDNDTGKVTLGANRSATVSIVCSREPGRFEFSKPSFVFKTSSEVGMVSVIRSGGTDGNVSLNWRIISLDTPSRFEGTEGYLSFKDGQISCSIEIDLEGVPSDAFVIVLQPSDDGPLLGATTRATVTIIGEIDEPVIEMDRSRLTFKDVEIMEVNVLRKGNVSDATYVGWKTIDGAALNGKHFIGGTGNLVFDSDEIEKKILIPVLTAPSDEAASFSVMLGDVRGVGKIGILSRAEITLEPIAKVPVVTQVLHQAAPTETIVEFLRKRYLFRQSQGSTLIPVRRSNASGVLALRWQTQTLCDDDENTKRGIDAQRHSSSSMSSSEETSLQSLAIDWGSGTITFEDGDHEANIDIVLCREMAHRESSFRIELVDIYDRVTFAVQSTMVTVIRDKDPGMLGFASPRYNFACSDHQLLIPVHRSSGADGTVSVPWFTRDATAVGGLHYLPAEGNLVFKDGEVLRKIIVPMPKRVEYFDEDEVAFKLCLGEPTGGASLSVCEAHVALRNDIVPSKISFAAPRVKCAQSSGTLQAPVKRIQDSNGLVTLSWQVLGQPGKPKSRYEGTTGSLVFADGETEKLVTIKLPAQVQDIGMESFNIILEEPSSGRAMLGENTQCAVTIDNDIIPGMFSIEKNNYTFKQSVGRDTIKILRDESTKGSVSLPWRILPASDNSPPSPMHDIHGNVKFDDGQTEADVTIAFPPDTDEDEEKFVFILLPPGGRVELQEPYRSDLHLCNDLRCEISFPKPVYDVRGDIDTLLVPVVRDGPKGRPATADFRTKDGTAVDCAHYIGGDGTLSFEAGENKKDILVPIMNDPDGGRVSFTIELFNVVGAAELGANELVTVHVNNLAGHGKFEMASGTMTTKQTLKEVKVMVLRKNGRKGIADVPWFVERIVSTSPGSTPTGILPADDYDDMEGTLHFGDGETEKEIIIPLSAKPQDNATTNIDVTLLTPTSGGGLSLGDVTSTRVAIENDLDGGVLEFESNRVEVYGTDGDVHIPVVRRGLSDHACQITWEASDDTAMRGKHYRAGKGSLAFIPNEKRKDIVIPIVNDPSGEVMCFNVALGNARGGAKLGANSKAQVLIDHVKEKRHAIEVPKQSSMYVHGEVEFSEPVAEFKQSNGKIVIKVTRKIGDRGRVVVPWSIKNVYSPKSAYMDLRGQEEFKDGEVESHIEIEMPDMPQDTDAESFSVVLGEPTGGAKLSSNTKCSVNVINDIKPGEISFSNQQLAVKQTDKEVAISLQRTKNTSGKVRVPWRTVGYEPESPFDKLTGVETFEDGDETSHIQIQIPQHTRETEEDNFDIILTSPKGHTAVLGDASKCHVTIENDISPALITFKEDSCDVLQSKGKVQLPLVRTQCNNGKVIVPWKVVPESPDSVYVGVVGEVTLDDGEDKGVVDINLPQLPLSNSKEKITVLLEPPVGASAQLADDAMCMLTITHDIGEGLIEMRSREAVHNSEDGHALIAVVRKLGHEFPAEIAWSTEDGDAVNGQHYEADNGRLKFRPGEMERNIRIPLVNDPSGDTRHFYVRLGEVKGRDKVGDITVSKVRICNEAMPPSAVGDFDADLVSPQAIRASWLPAEDGSPVYGYKVTYWSRPGTVQTIQQPRNATEITLDNLQPSTTYQLNVRPMNDVGDGPASETVVVETQPELRLSYHTPMQVKTSEKVAIFTLKRNIRDFDDVVTWKIVKETRKKKKSSKSVSSSSSSSSMSSSNSDDGTDDATMVVSSGTLEFPPGCDQSHVEFPLSQDMRHSSQVYRLLASKPPSSGSDQKSSPREHYIANVELNVINNTGYPGRVRRPLASSTSPFESIISWEAPASGGPVHGYKVIAKSEGEPDVVADVGPDARKTNLSGLRPSTNYDIIVQPYNIVGSAGPSPTAKLKTQDELKIEFSERFYTFKSSDKVAVIPIKRHFTRGYTTLNWKAQWCKRTESSTDSSDTSSSSDSENEESREREWASGSVTFPDGVDTAEVRIPLQQASPPPAPRKRSFFWLHVDDPNKQRRIAAMRCKLEDDRARLAAPKNVRTVVNSASCFSVAWGPQEAPVHEYLVSYKRAGSNEDPQRHTVPPNEYSLTIEGLVPESAYGVVVSALGDNGQQASSDVIGCKLPGEVPGPPNRLAFQVLSPTSLNCSWGEPAITNGLITGYEVLYKPADDEIGKMHPPVVVRIPDGHFRSLLVENLFEDTTYLYVVRAQNKSGLGDPREATMKIEHVVGARPPSAIFLDEENMKAVQEQIRLEEAQKREKMKNRSTSSMSSDGSQTNSVTKSPAAIGQAAEMTNEVATSSETKTRVTRYIHKDGKSEPEVEVVEYEGRLSQEDLAKIAAKSERIEVQVITYNTTRSKSAAGIAVDGTPPTGSTTSTTPMQIVSYEPQPEEYTNTDIRRDISQDTQVFTDVQESTDGDTEVTTITKTYKTTTTERRLETTSGMKSILLPRDGKH